MPSPLNQSRSARHHKFASALAAAGLLALTTVGWLAGGCAGRIKPRPDASSRQYPAPPQAPCVVALGNLRDAQPPSQAEVDLARFFFGAEPPASLTIANPAGLAVSNHTVLICDTTLDAILSWNEDPIGFGYACPPARLDHPFAIDVLPDNSRLICDRQGVWACDSINQPQRAFRTNDFPFRPAGVLAVDGEVWISNPALHRIEVFDRQSGTYLRSIGQQGTGPGEFALPRSLAHTPTGDVCIVDLLNCRVQVFAKDGTWLRSIGGPGDNVGSFGRPRGVAVGPDGTIFVSDSFSQRVHAFTSDGQPLLAFGTPNTGPGALAMPAGITITKHPPHTDQPLPDNLRPDYYILVAEQLQRPGVRVYAWLGSTVGAADQHYALPAGVALIWEPRSSQATAVNPHWQPDRCNMCHAGGANHWQPIPTTDVDALCLDCHDGVQASRDPHPIGRPAHTEVISTPTEWPTPGDTLGCLTCHDIKQHCEPNAQPPANNRMLLRGFDPRRPLDYCANCHQPDGGQRFSPHQQRDSTGKVRADTCLFCHTERPDVPPDGRRQFQPMLRTDNSRLCLNCHREHWDLSPRGHVGRPVPDNIRKWMLMRELSRSRSADAAELGRLADEHNRPPALLPLGEGRVTCFTCHNPHYAGLFAPDSELGALATNPRDRQAALRTDWIDLCSECHRR